MICGNKYYRDRFECKKGNARDTWRLINDVLQDKVSINNNCTVSEIVMGDKVVSDPLEIATKFNNVFINIGRISLRRLLNHLTMLL